MVADQALHGRALDDDLRMELVQKAAQSKAGDQDLSAEVPVRVVHPRISCFRSYVFDPLVK